MRNRQLHPSTLHQGQIVTLRKASLAGPKKFTEHRVRFSGAGTFDNPVSESGIPSCYHLDFPADRPIVRAMGFEFTMWECQDQSVPPTGWSYQQ